MKTKQKNVNKNMQPSSLDCSVSPGHNHNTSALHHSAAIHRFLSLAYNITTTQTLQRQRNVWVSFFSACGILAFRVDFNIF